MIFEVGGYVSCVNSYCMIGELRADTGDGERLAPLGQSQGCVNGPFYRLILL